jgi:hypothetical protein
MVLRPIILRRSHRRWKLPLRLVLLALFPIILLAIRAADNRII